MTQAGRLVLSVYSLLAIVILIASNVTKVVKKGGRGWTIVLLIPVLIFLCNTI